MTSVYYSLNHVSPDKEGKILAAIYRSMFACRGILAVNTHTWVNNDFFLSETANIGEAHDSGPAVKKFIGISSHCRSLQSLEVALIYANYFIFYRDITFPLF